MQVTTKAVMIDSITEESGFFAFKYSCDVSTLTAANPSRDCFTLRNGINLFEEGKSLVQIQNNL